MRIPKASSPDLFPDVAAIRKQWTAEESRVRQFVDGLGDAGVTRVIEYKLITGQPSAQPIWQMVQHLVNHASYHRGQVTTMLRQLGAQPAKSMDMVAFYRERAVKA